MVCIKKSTWEIMHTLSIHIYFTSICTSIYIHIHVKVVRASLWWQQLQRELVKFSFKWNRMNYQVTEMVNEQWSYQPVKVVKCTCCYCELHLMVYIFNINAAVEMTNWQYISISYRRILWYTYVYMFGGKLKAFH